jgi:hypothetical protein
MIHLAGAEAVFAWQLPRCDKKNMVVARQISDNSHCFV